MSTVDLASIPSDQGATTCAKAGVGKSNSPSYNGEKRMGECPKLRWEHVTDTETERYPGLGGKDVGA